MAESEQGSLGVSLLYIIGRYLPYYCHGWLESIAVDGGCFKIILFTLYNNLIIPRYVE